MRGFIIFLVVPAANASTCATSGTGSFMEDTTEWYRALTYCAYNAAGSPIRPNQFNYCLNNLPSSDNQPTILMGASLSIAFDVATRADLPSDCFRCAYDFVMAVRTALKNGSAGVILLTACLDTNGLWTADSVKSSACQWGLYDAITAFNSCSGNGFDIVTKAASTRCTAAEFTNFAIAHNPLSAIAECTFDDTSLISATAIANCVGASYVTDKASLGCESCFDPLMAGIQVISPSCIDVPGVFDFNGCSDVDLDGLIEDFGVCSGGMAFEDVAEAHCSADQMRVITAMRPYTSMIKCTYIDDNTQCLDYYNAVVPALNELDNNAAVCSGYFNTFASGTYYNRPAADCETSPFGSACTDELTNVYAYLYDTEISTGMTIITNTTVCTSPQWTAMAASDKSYIPFVRCAMKGISPTDVLDCIEGDSLLTTTLAAVPCASCFEQFAIEAYVARKADQSGLTDIVCSDPYSNGCMLAMNAPLLIFEACSGFDAMIISSTECSAAALSSLEADNAGMAQVIALLNNSVTVTEAIYRYSQISETLSTTEYPCMSCYLDLIGNLFKLSDTDTAACVADITSWDCYVAMGTDLDVFWRCSLGWTSSAVATRRPPLIPN